MALLDWRGKRERDVGGIDTDANIRRKFMLISRLSGDAVFSCHAART